jgi:hypothetical protein
MRAHRSGGLTVRGQWQRWAMAFRGGEEAPVANGGGGRHLQHQRAEGKVRGKAIWLEKA